MAIKCLYMLSQSTAVCIFHKLLNSQELNSCFLLKVTQNVAVPSGQQVCARLTTNIHQDKVSVSWSREKKILIVYIIVCISCASIISIIVNISCASFICKCYLLCIWPLLYFSLDKSVCLMLCNITALWRVKVIHVGHVLVFWCFQLPQQCWQTITCKSHRYTVSSATNKNGRGKRRICEYIFLIVKRDIM